MEDDTVFGKIIRGEIPAAVVFESDDVMAIKDIAPRAPVHLLIFPKKPFRDLQSVPPKELHVVAECFAVAQKLAEEHGVADAYRVVVNNGVKAGQSVFHLHFHLLGGRRLGVIG
jgi:histidine triad (HIT) family protein